MILALNRLVRSTLCECVPMSEVDCAHCAGAHALTLAVLDWLNAYDGDDEWSDLLSLIDVEREGDDCILFADGDRLILQPFQGWAMA